MGRRSVASWGVSLSWVGGRSNGPSHETTRRQMTTALRGDDDFVMLSVREIQRDGATGPGPARDRHPSSVQFGDALDDRQAKADALAGGTGRVGPVEPIEEAGQMLGRDPDTRIGDGDDQALRPRGGGLRSPGRLRACESRRWSGGCPGPAGTGSGRA